LLDAARKGDHEAFKALVISHESQVAATIIGMLGRCSEAEDIGQETFMRFYKALDHFKGESQLGTYLIRIAINLSINELKRRQRRNRLFQPSPDPGLEMESYPSGSSAANPWSWLFAKWPLPGLYSLFFFLSIPWGQEAVCQWKRH
jgi:DNA-directed RNA polymerase specialized sigma24 family protein